MTADQLPRVGVVLVAAGSGTRLGAGTPKAFVDIDEHTVLWHALRSLVSAAPDEVVIVAPQDMLDLAERIAVDALGASPRAVVAGGSSRQASVAAGLAALSAEIDVVLVHDAARALTPASVFARVCAEVIRTGGGVVPALPVVDSLKRVEKDRVSGVVDRSTLVSAQTPQGFPRTALIDAYRAANAEYTDDAALLQAAGGQVVHVLGDAEGFKVTTPNDLERARHVLASRESEASTVPMLPRVGIGTDVHAFDDSEPLWLAGLEWPGHRALSGHSDGDAVAHAIVDAVLAAAGLGDIGTHFGVDRPEFAGAHGAQFLREVRRIVTDAGWQVGNVSVQVQASSPKFSPRRLEAEQALSEALGAPVAISATTTDGLGFVGAQEGVQALAVALVVPASNLSSSRHTA